jgi:hypothetical protein
VTPRSGTSIDYWWFDPVKAARLEAERKTEGQAADGSSPTVPGIGATIVVIAGLGIAGFFVFRRVWQRTGVS